MYSHGILPYSLYFPKRYTQITLTQWCILNRRKAVYKGKQLKSPNNQETHITLYFSEHATMQMEISIKRNNSDVCSSTYMELFRKNQYEHCTKTSLGNLLKSFATLKTDYFKFVSSPRQWQWKLKTQREDILLALSKNHQEVFLKIKVKSILLSTNLTHLSSGKLPSHRRPHKDSNCRWT